MNTVAIKEFVEEHGIIAVKADKTIKGSRQANEINELLVELGNHAKIIPVCAIYPADGGEPILLNGLITQAMVLEALATAVPQEASGDGALTAMKPTP